jgi:hypothetical protein
MLSAYFVLLSSSNRASLAAGWLATGEPRLLHSRRDTRNPGKLRSSPPVSQTPVSPFTFDFEPKAGLSVILSGVPVIRGSWFEVTSRDGNKSIYESRYEFPHYERKGPHLIFTSFDADSKQFEGSQTFSQTQFGLSIRSHFVWHGAESVRIRMMSAQVWSPAVDSGKLTSAANAISLSVRSGSRMERLLCPPSGSYRFEAPLGSLELQSSSPQALVDARKGFSEDWADAGDLLGWDSQSIELKPNQPLDLEANIRFEPKARGSATVMAISGNTQAIPVALTPDTSLPVLVPKPKWSRLDFRKPCLTGSDFPFFTGEAVLAKRMGRFVSDRFRPTVGKKTKSPKLFAKIIPSGLRPGGYRLEMDSASVRLIAQDQEGIENGLGRLRNLLFVSRGTVALPTGLLVDEPKTTWRGVHLFVGPEALEFQTNLWQKFLRPLGFNKVVLQCERTDWKSQPGIKTPITMPLPKLVSLFDRYRAMSVEPIPLIQSFGHANWLFANGQNRDIAFNNKELYAVDPRIPRTREVLKGLWNEVIHTLKPKTIHFGMDEVDMIGFPKDPPLVTELWNKQIPFLGELAQEHNVRPMMWGDKGLADGEAVDATFGDSPAEAASRRGAIPKGTLIGDWHYHPDPSPEPFLASLKLWKANGDSPVASIWYRPENVRGFSLAAIKEGAGTLQTTWAGYESNEANMIRCFNQFSAMVLAADYSWSGRTESLDNLGYNPGDVLRRAYFSPRSSTSSTPGFTCAKGNVKPFVFNSVHYLLGDPILFASTILPPERGEVSVLTYSPNVAGQEVDLALQCRVRCGDGEPVALVSVTLGDGSKIERSLSYGRHLRAVGDVRPFYCADQIGDMASVQIDLGRSSQIKEIRITSLNPYAGLVIKGLTIAK